MPWKPSRLTHKQLEERRLEGGRLLREKRLSPAEIARHLGVSRAAVSQWAQRLKTGGIRRLRRRSPPGRPPRLRPNQRRRLLAILKRGACAAGFSTERWTLDRIQQVIQREFSISYHPHYVGSWLKQWGWSCQYPIDQARERDEELVEAWLRRDWPRIKKSTAP